MADDLLNGREPMSFEVDAVAHARQCERERDLRQLKGVLASEREQERVARPVTDIVWQFR
jgi:hypothetical protein